MGKKVSIFDEKPQIIRHQIVESAANTLTQNSFASPNLTELGFVMEIIKMWMEIEAVIGAATGDEIEVAIHENSSAAMPNYNDSGVIAKFKRHVNFTTSGQIFIDHIQSREFTDGAGNGLLTGRKELFASIEGTSQSAAMTANFAILYRLVKVTPAELVGLIAG